MVRSMEIYRAEESESFSTPEGIITPIFASQKISIMNIKIPAGLKVKPHSHSEDGILIVTNGSIRLTGDSTIDLKTGDLVSVSGNTSAGLECDEEATALAISVPSNYKNVEELCNVLRSFFASDGSVPGGI